MYMLRMYLNQRDLTKSVTMNIFEKNSFLFKSFVKVELSYVFTIKNVEYSWKLHVCISSIVKRYMRDAVKTHFGLLKIQLKF